MKTILTCCFPNKTITIPTDSDKEAKFINDNDSLNKYKDSQFPHQGSLYKLEREKTKDVDGYSNQSEPNNNFSNLPLLSQQSPRHSKVSNFTFFPHDNSTPQSNNTQEELSSQSTITISSSSFNNSITSNQVITNSIIQSSPYIELYEVEGSEFKGQKIIIEANGYKNSIRKANDGFTFFGAESSNEKGELINDIILSMGTNEEKVQQDHYFVIYYNVLKEQYFIRTFKQTSMNYYSLIFIRITHSYPIVSNEIFLFGEILFKLSVDNKDQTLTVHQLSSKKYKDVDYTFASINGDVTIGRDRNCSISFSKSKAFSKVHCTISYSKKEKCWRISDGGSKSSANGCWVLPKHSYPIEKEFEIKILGGSRIKGDVKVRLSNDSLVNLL